MGKSSFAFFAGALVAMLLAGCSGVSGPRFIVLPEDDGGALAEVDAGDMAASVDAASDSTPTVYGAVNPLDAGWCRSADGLSALPLPPQGCGYYTGVLYCATCVDGGCAPVRHGFSEAEFVGTCQ